LFALRKELESKASKSDVDAVLTRVVILGDKIDDYRADQSATKWQVEIHNQ
jgi:hypothetical protein